MKYNAQTDIVISSAVLVLKSLVQTQLSINTTLMPNNQHSSLSIISHLARRIDDIRHAQARACVLWLAGQYSSSEECYAFPAGVAKWAPDLLRKATKTFTSEVSCSFSGHTNQTTHLFVYVVKAPIVKLQIITLAAKLFVLCPTDRRLELLKRYVFSLARYDLNYDVRDRARMVAALLAGLAPTPLMNGEEISEGKRGGVVLRREQVKLVLFEGKGGDVDVEGGQGVELPNRNIIRHTYQVCPSI
jgi:Vesicle coat complex, various subunits